jgi:hypothetical protein
MKLQWEIDNADCEVVRDFVAKHRDKNFVRGRIQHNVDGPLPQFSENGFWKGLVMCLLTTQQQSGPRSAVTRFLLQKPFPLSLAECRQAPTAGHFTRVLQDAGGLRRSTTIGHELETNLKTLDGGGYALVAEMARRLLVQRSREPKASGILPCVFDAVVFASYDPEWDEDSLVF